MAVGIAHGSFTPVQPGQLYPLPAAGLRSDCGYRGVSLCPSLHSWFAISIFSKTLVTRLLL